jgi:hypothetical protein
MAAGLNTVLVDEVQPPGTVLGVPGTAAANQVPQNYPIAQIVASAPNIIFPASVQTNFGGSVAGAVFGTFSEEGNLYRNVGNPIAGNAADTTDDILGGIVLPAGAFDQLGRGLCIVAQGNTGATTNNKRFKIFINPTMSGQTVTNGVISGGTVSAGTPVCDSGTWVNGTTANNAAGWQAMASLFKYGVGGSNTQFVQGQAILGTLHGGMQAAQFLTLTESAVINIVVTGASYTTGAANDLKLQLFEVNAMD